jgi:competence protein ComEC
VQFIVASHPHNDHIGGIPNLIQYFIDNGAEICGFWDSGHYRPIRACRRIQDIIETHLRTVTIYPKAGDGPYRFGDIRKPVVIRVLAPIEPLNYMRHIANNSSIILSVSYGKARLLFGADAEIESWGKMTNCVHRNFLRSAFLKVSHHGSIRGPGHQFIVDYIEPKVAAITGKNSIQSRVGFFPNPIVIDALTRVGSDIGCTFDHGDLVIESYSNGKHKLYN